MKVNPINAYNVQNKNLNPISNPINFGIGRKQTSELTKEGRESLEISYTMGDINTKIKDVKKSGKIIHKIGKVLLKAGKSVDFQNYRIDYNKEKGEKIVYGSVNQETGYPATISVVSTATMETRKIFNFADNLFNPFLTYTVFEQEDVNNYEWIMKEKEVVSYSETKKGSNITRVYFPEKNGFSYQEVKTNDKGKNEIIAEIKYCDNKKNPEFYYSRTEETQDGQIVGEFTYNQKTKMWERQNKLNVEV